MNRIFPDAPTFETGTQLPRRTIPVSGNQLTSEAHALAQPPGLKLGDIYYVLFRHKWKILLSAIAGIGAAAAVQRFNSPLYQSEAKLFVRYIISENKTLGPANHDASAKSPDQRGETIMRSEAELIGSQDLSRQVVEAIGAEKILARAGGGKDTNAALGLVKGNLSVNVAPNNSVITVVFKHPDLEMVQPILREVIERYYKLHFETHTANGMLGDFLNQETDQLKARLSQTEEELRKATLKAGIISLEDAKEAYSGQLAGIRRDLYEAQAELAQRAAVLEELNRRFPPPDRSDKANVALPAEAVSQYQTAAQQVLQLQQTERELLTQFTPESARVKEIRALLAEAVQTRDKLLAQHPKLTEMALASQRGPDSGGLDSIAVSTQVTALQAKIKTLTKQLDDVRAEANRVEQMEGTIIELRRKKELDEAQYRYFAVNLEQSRINETLGNGRASNIIQIQAPSAPVRDDSKIKKIVGMILGAGLLGGIAWAFFIELYFDRSLKRAVDVERSIRAPLMLAIPSLRRKQLKAASSLMLGPGTNGQNGAANGTNGHAVATTEESHPLQPFHETLRDRLINYFESINLTHKPKLVAVTGLTRRAGVTTTATGLARSLSETGEGNVLLVDMNVGQGVAHQFLKGKPVCGIDELLEARDNAHVEEKLYVVSESNSDRLTRNMPQRFTKLVPKLKASDFDYIIFDMPPISQISITPRLAGFMDMVLMVVESEKTDRDLVQRATSLLSESRTHVGIVLNKTKGYVPARLHQDNLSSS